MADDKSSDARKRASTYFSASDQRDAVLKDELEKKRLGMAAKSAKLKALRLAKEETDRAEAAKAPPAKVTAKKPRASKA